MDDKPLQKNGYITWIIIHRWEYDYDDFGEHKYPVGGLEVLSKSEEDVLYLLTFSEVEYVSYAPVIEEIDASDVEGKLGRMPDEFDPLNN